MQRSNGTVQLRHVPQKYFLYNQHEDQRSMERCLNVLGLHKPNGLLFYYCWSLNKSIINHKQHG